MGDVKLTEEDIKSIDEAGASIDMWKVGRWAVVLGLTGAMTYSYKFL